MREERFCRRPGFRPGRSIRLADGQFWTFPVPTEDEGTSLDSSTCEDYQALLRGCLEAEDEPDRRRAELALAIALLDANYLLETADFPSLLDFGPGDPLGASVQEALARIACEHIRAFRMTAGPASSRRERSRWRVLVLPWRWLGMISHPAPPPKAHHRRPTVRRPPIAHESRV